MPGVNTKSLSATPYVRLRMEGVFFLPTMKVCEQTERISTMWPSRVVFGMALLAGLGAGLGTGDAWAQARFQPLPDGDEVRDARSGLIWRRCAEGMTWKSGRCDGKAVAVPHPSAVARASEEAARTGKPWRLPTMKELSAIASVTEADPANGVAAIDGSAFPGTPAMRFWTSSSAGPHYFMYVGFKDADVGENTRTLPAAIRLVRNAN